jgi:hypothetical protein
MAKDLFRSVRQIKNCCVSDEMDIMEDEEEHTKFFLGMYSL